MTKKQLMEFAEKEGIIGIKNYYGNKLTQQKLLKAKREGRLVVSSKLVITSLNPTEQFSVKLNRDT